MRSGPSRPLLLYCILGVNVGTQTIGNDLSQSKQCKYVTEMVNQAHGVQRSPFTIFDFYQTIFKHICRYSNDRKMLMTYLD